MIVLIQKARLISLLVLSLLLAVSSAAQADDKSRKPKIKVVTYNLYVGADIFRVFDPPPCGVPQAVSDIHRIIQENNFPERAEAIADQIMEQEPHVIGLQEVSKISTQFPGNSLAPDGSGIELLGVDPETGFPLFTFKADADDVEFDYLVLLLEALADRGLDYVVIEAASPTNADVEFPAIDFDGSCNPMSFPEDVRLTDRDVILVRADLPVNFAFQKNFQFNAPIQLPTFLPTPAGPVQAIYMTEFTRGWGAVNLTIKDQSYSVINTHLEVGDKTLPPNEGLNLVQAAQALEVGSVGIDVFVDDLPAPRILVGDINSSPYSGTITDPRPAYSILTVFFEMDDVWNPAVPGFTCCQWETLNNPVSALDERIDVVLAHFGDLVPDKIKADVLGEELDDKSASGLWPSDHAGVGAKLTFQR